MGGRADRAGDRRVKAVVVGGCETEDGDGAASERGCEATVSKKRSEGEVFALAERMSALL